MINTDALLRPQYLSEVIGMPQIKARLHTVIAAALIRKTKLGNILLSGPAGTGKSLLAHVIAREMGLGTVVTTGIDLAKDAWQVKNMVVAGSLLFIDEIHQLNRKGQDVLLPWLEQGQIKTTWWAKEGNRYVGVEKQADFICIGATTIPGPLQRAFEQRFALRLFLTLYSVDELAQIAARSARLLGLIISPDGLREVAKRSKGTPRIVNSNLLWYIQQYAIYHSLKCLYPKEVCAALDEFGVDELGLNDRDRFYLEKLNLFNRPTGLRPLADAMTDTPNALRDIEPFLVECGLVALTQRGREITDAGKKHLKGN